MGAFFDYNDQHEVVAGQLNRVERAMDLVDDYAAEGLDICSSSIQEKESRGPRSAMAAPKQHAERTTEQHDDDDDNNYTNAYTNAAASSSIQPKVPQLRQPRSAMASHSARPFAIRCSSQHSARGETCSIGTPISTRSGARTGRSVRFASTSAPDSRGRSETPIWDRLIHRSLQRDEELWRRQQVAEEFRIVNECIGCTFRPRTNNNNEPKSKNAMEAHERLYNDAIRKEKKRLEVKKAVEAKREKELERMQLANKGRKTNEDIEVTNNGKFWNRLYQKPEKQAPKTVTKPAADPAKARKGQQAALRLYKAAAQKEEHRVELIEKFEKDRETKLRNAILAAGLHPIHNNPPSARRASASPPRSPKRTMTGLSLATTAARPYTPMVPSLPRQQHNDFDNAQEEYTSSLKRAIEADEELKASPRKDLRDLLSQTGDEENASARASTPPPNPLPEERSDDIELYDLPDDSVSNNSNNNVAAATNQHAEEEDNAQVGTKDTLSKTESDNYRAINNHISASALIAMSLSD